MAIDVSFCSGRCDHQRDMLVDSLGTYSWICYGAWCLYLNDLLDKFDTAYSNICSSSIPSLQYVGFDSDHVIPHRYIDWVVNTVMESQASVNSES